MARYQKRESLIATSLTAGWKFSAMVAAGSLLLTWVFIPILSILHPILRLFIPALQQLGFLFTLIFGVIALIKFLIEFSKRKNLNTFVYESKKEKIEPKLVIDSEGVKSFTSDFLKGLSTKSFNFLCESYFIQRGIKTTLDNSIRHGEVYLKLQENDSDTTTAIAICEVGYSGIGIVDVAKLYKTMKSENIRRGYYITTGSFSQAAIDFVTDVKIRLIDGEELLLMINALSELSKKQMLLAASKVELHTQKSEKTSQAQSKAKSVGKEQGREAAAKWSIDLLNALEWKRFEELCAAYFTEVGVKNELTSLGADGGVDIRLYENNSATPTCLVQCKSYSKLVGVKLIREFIGVMHLEKVNKGTFITTSKFNDAAVSAASENNITLIDGVALINLIRSLPSEVQDRLLEYATSGDFSTPTCVKCGLKMVRRKTKQKDFWGCANFPRCRMRLWI